MRFHHDNILSLSIIPGPRKPVDIDSFLWPMVLELLRLAEGVQAFNVLSEHMFQLHAYLIVAFGDIPAVSMLMHMKGHNRICPCQMCTIRGLCMPDSGGTTHYVPHKRANHPDVSNNPQMVQDYNPADLPLRNHAQFMCMAVEVENARTKTEAENLAKKFGVKGILILAHLDSLSFPISFSYNFMHLIWENLIKNLILLWTGEFKGLDTGDGDYVLPKTVWEAIGEATAAAGSTIPSAYGSCVPNISKDRTTVSAEMWSFWTLYIGPVLLRNKFSQQKYYDHFVRLVSLLTICLKFEISHAEIETVRVGFEQWVTDYERYVYISISLLRLLMCVW